MIRPLLLSLCVTLGGWSLSGSAVADVDADHAALKELVTAYEQAIAAGDPNSLKPHLADDFTGVMVTGEEVTNLAGLDAYWQKIQGYLGEGGKYTVEVVVPEPAVIVGDLAFSLDLLPDVGVDLSRWRGVHAYLERLHARPSWQDIWPHLIFWAAKQKISRKICVSR